jgi:sugar phosphate isomerase/epimerase
VEIQIGLILTVNGFSTTRPISFCICRRICVGGMHRNPNPRLIMNIGAQMYTLRESCGTPDDIARSLEKVKAMGYDGVQGSAAGFNTLDEADLKQIKQALDDNGLVCAATHESLDNMRDHTEAVITKHRILGCTYTAIGGALWGSGSTAADWEAFADEFNGITATLNDAGIRAGYHNHSHEFQKLDDGRTPMAILLQNFAPHVWMELDVYWVAHGLADPAEWVRAIAHSGDNRIPCVHYKDGTVTGEREHVMMPVGEGNLCWPRVNGACAEAGVEWALVERDAGPHDPFEALELSIRNIRGMGL